MPLAVELAPVLSGFLFGSISLVSIGPNNVMLLREGLVGRHPITLATTVYVSYLGLLTAAVFLGALLPPSNGLVQSTLSWLGVALLILFGGQMLASAQGGSGSFVFGEAAGETAAACIRRGLSIVWINPLTYLELFLIPAGLAAHLGAIEQRGALLAGMALAFALNCYGFTLGARILAPFARGERTRRLLDQFAGLAMIAVALALGYATLLARQPESQPTTLGSLAVLTP